VTPVVFKIFEKTGPYVNTMTLNFCFAKVVEICDVNNRLCVAMATVSRALCLAPISFYVSA